jgi:hypothetical protein
MNSAILQGVPNIGKIEDKSLNRAFARKRIDTRQLLGIAARPINGDGSLVRLDQPREGGTVRDPFLHLFANRPGTVARRSQLNDEVWAEVPEAFARSRAHLLDPGLQHPGRIRRSSSSIRQDKATRRVAYNATTISNGPVCQLSANLSISKTGDRKSSGHDDEFPFGSHLKGQIGMLRAQGRKLVVRHWMRCEHGGQMFLINSERHDLSVTRWAMVHFGFDRTRDITVVTIQRNS